MKYSPRFIGIGLLFLFALVSCQQDEPSLKSDKVVIPGTPQAYFEELRKRKDPQEIIDLANKGLAAAEDLQDTVLHFLLSHKIYYHNRLRQYDSSLFFADSLYSLGQRQKDTMMMGEGLYRKFAVYHYYLGDAREAYRYAFEGRKLFSQYGDSLKVAERLINMASVQKRVGDYSGSYESATDALKYLLPSRDSSRISQAYSFLGLAYREQGFYQEAVQEFKNALPYAQQEQEKFSLRNNLAMTNLDQKKYDLAIQGLEELKKDSDSSNLQNLALLINNLAYARWQKDSSSDVEDEFLEALAIRLERADKYALMDSYDWLFEYYENTEPERATEMARKHLEIARETGHVKGELDALKHLIDILPPDEVAAYSRSFVKLNDSLTMERLREKNAFAKIRFDEQNKEKEILGLQVRNARQALRSENMKTRVMIGGLVGALILLGLSFLIYFLRQKYKAEKVREVHRTETRISKRIHDELANDVYNVMSSLEARGSSEAVDRLEHIYRRTRDFSRENAEIDTGKEYAEGLRTMLSMHTSNSRLILKGDRSVPWELYSEEIKIVVYRVLQELMVNMKKHSRAKLVALSFSDEQKYLEIKYSDMGVGADPTVLKDRNGLQNLENRLASVSGKVSFSTGEGKGFKADIKIPV